MSPPPSADQCHSEYGIGHSHLRLYDFSAYEYIRSGAIINGLNYCINSIISPHLHFATFPFTSFYALKIVVIILHMQCHMLLPPSPPPS